MQYTIISIPHITVIKYNAINCTLKLYNTNGRGRLWGPPLGLEKTLHTENKLKNIN